MNFYDRYIELCNQAGKTPSAVAEEIGLSRTAVHRWKTGGGVTDATAAKVAKYFNVPLSKLTDMFPETVAITSYDFDLDEPGKKKKPAEDGELFKKQLKLIDFVRTVPEDKIDLILRVMQSILEDNA